jgi:hypothetical protein
MTPCGVLRIHIGTLPACLLPCLFDVPMRECLLVRIAAFPPNLARTKVASSGGSLAQDHRSPCARPLSVRSGGRCFSHPGSRSELLDSVPVPRCDICRWSGAPGELARPERHSLWQHRFRGLGAGWGTVFALDSTGKENTALFVHRRCVRFDATIRFSARRKREPLLHSFRG